MLALIPMDEAYNGMKNGGTSSGNVAMPDPMKSKMNLGSRNSDLWEIRVLLGHDYHWHTYHSIEEATLRVRSLKSIAAGIVAARVMKPVILKVHATPTRSNKACVEMLRTAPPIPPPAKTKPLARPRLLEKY
jgi:hypothetical protein